MTSSKVLMNQNHFLLKKCSFDHDETRTRNLLIRSQTPYPLGHAATILHNNVLLQNFTMTLIQRPAQLQAGCLVTLNMMGGQHEPYCFMFP